MKHPGLLMALVCGLSTLGSVGHAVQHVVVTNLDDPTNPPVISAGVGYASVAIDYDAHTLTIDVSFSGLTGTVTTAHIHCCVDRPGTVLPATMLPTLLGFPAGVTGGSYHATFDTLSVATYHPLFVTNNGGSVVGAENALLVGLLTGRAYLDIHTAAFTSGELRGYPLPELSIEGVTQAEGNAGTTVFNVLVKVSSASGHPVQATVATADGSAVSPADYAAVSPTVLTFAPGGAEMSQSVLVQVVGDTAVEPDETFTIQLSGPVNAVLSASQTTAVATISNDDVAMVPAGEAATWAALAFGLFLTGAWLVRRRLGHAPGDPSS
jgi:hypothetical protein